MTDGVAPPALYGANVPAGFHAVWRTASNPKECNVNATSRIANIQSTSGASVGADNAESAFQLCEADTKWQRRGKHRLCGGQFEHWFDNRGVASLVMAAYGAAHYWMR